MKMTFTPRSFIPALALVFFSFYTAFGQTGVVISRLSGTADPSAQLDIISDGTPSWKGLLIPRMTETNRTGIASPATGLLVYQTDATPGFYYNAGTPGTPNWTILSAGALSGAGSNNYVVKWTGTNTLSTTSLIYDNGSSVGINTATPAGSAALDVSSTTQGFAMPRMTTAQRIAIASPVDGLQVYDTNLKGYYYYNGTKWDCVTEPAGTIDFFANSTAPTGYLAASGQAVSRTQYPELFAAIGTTYGAGDGSTTFNLPDLRGEFVRGLDGGRGVDPGRTIGSAQAHDWKGFSQTNTLHNTYSYSHGPVNMGKSTSTHIGNLFIGYWSAPAAALGTMWDGSEIRPRNVALLACIKY